MKINVQIVGFLEYNLIFTVNNNFFSKWIKERLIIQPKSLMHFSGLIYFERSFTYFLSVYIYHIISILFLMDNVFNFIYSFIRYLWLYK